VAPVAGIPQPLLRIGLTGGIGSGKTTVAGFLAQAAAHVIDTDAIARRLTARDGKALPALAAAFGAGILDADGALDREAMRARVFADARARQQLESILHPMIGNAALEQATSVPPAASCIVFDVPLLAESSGWRARVHRVLVIDCDESTQVSRVAGRAGWTEAAAQSVVTAQVTRARRRAVADAVIWNESLTLGELALEAAAVLSFWRRTVEVAVEQ
jgi:dephospho-CoA kinase